MYKAPNPTRLRTPTDNERNDKLLPFQAFILIFFFFFFLSLILLCVFSFSHGWPFNLCSLFPQCTGERYQNADSFCYTEFISGNIKIYFHFQSFLNTSISQVLKFLAHGRQGADYPVVWISWLLMTWWCKEPYENIMMCVRKILLVTSRGVSSSHSRYYPENVQPLVRPFNPYLFSITTVRSYYLHIVDVLLNIMQHSMQT